MSNQFNIEPRTVLLVSAHVLTASFTDTGAVGYMQLDASNFLGLLIKYTAGSETLAQVKVDVTCDKSLGIIADTANISTATNWFQRVAESTTSGATAIVQDVFTIAASTGNYAEVIFPIKGDGVRISCNATGTVSSAGTMTIWGITSWA